MLIAWTPPGEMTPLSRVIDVEINLRGIRSYNMLFVTISNETSWATDRFFFSLKNSIQNSRPRDSISVLLIEFRWFPEGMGKINDGLNVITNAWDFSKGSQFSPAVIVRANAVHGDNFTSDDNNNNDIRDVIYVCMCMHYIYI